MNNNKYKADLARIQHYYNDTKAAYGDYLQELISTPSCLDLKQESEDWGAQNMDDVEHAYQKSRKTCEFTIFLIDLLLKKSKEGGESDDSPFLNVLKEMRGYMHRIGELIISANKKFWGWDNEDGVVNILELINNTRKKCKDYAEILEKIEKGVDEMELGQSVVTSAPSNTGETNLSDVNMVSKLYQEMEHSVHDFNLYVGSELPSYIESSEEHFSSKTMKELEANAHEIK